MSTPCPCGRLEEVSFIARQRDRSGRAIRMHERSRFVRENGSWYYVDGDSSS